MALPKGFRNNIRLTSPNVGVQRRQDLLDNIADDGTFLPRGVHYQDMDETFINFVNKELRIEIDGEEVPVLFLTLQRYSEFTKTWKFTDEYKNIKIPFVTIVRKPDPQVGTNQAGLYNVPGRPTFTYYKVPTNDGARVGVDLYKIPQPTSVDITYEVRMFTNKMSDLNLLNEKVQKKFQSRQAYIWPKGHPMPVTLESIGDESNIDDFENRRFYVQPFEMLLAGYILDEEDFEIMPTINRAMVMSELIVGDGVTTPVTDGTNSPGCVVAAQGSSIIKNTAGTLLSVVECGSNYVVGNSLVFNSGSTYSQIIPATTNLELPNQVIDIENETGGTINTITFPVYSDPTIDLTAYCQSVIVNNSGGTFNQTIEPGSAYTLPNITHIDSDGSNVTLPAQTPFSATSCAGVVTVNIGTYSDSGHTIPVSDPNYGDTVYVEAEVTGISPTQYIFFGLTTGGTEITLIETTTGNTTTFTASDLPSGENGVYVMVTEDDVEYFGATTPITIPLPPLWFNVYPNALFGISTMQLDENFTDPQIRVRENVTEDDFTVNPSSATIPHIDLTANGDLGDDLGTFLGSNDGFVPTVYDQNQIISVNNATQSTASQQPRIASGGTLYPLFSTRNGYSLDGTDDYLTGWDNVQAPVEFRTLSDSLSVVTIVQPTEVTGNLAANIWYGNYTITEIISRESFPSGKRVPFSLGINDSKVTLGVIRTTYASTTQRFSSTATLSNDTTYTIGATISGDTAKIYIDGILDSTHTINFTGRTIDTRNSNLNIGCSVNQSNVLGVSPFKGLIDTVVITDQVYDDVEMLDIHNQYGTEP